MMQVVDRRSQAGPSSASTTMTVGSPLTSPKKAAAFPPSPRMTLAPDGKGSAFPKSQMWSTSIEDSAITRTQQFIIETLKNPIHFKLSDAPISAEVPYLPINDSNISIDSKSPGPSRSPMSKDGTIVTSPVISTSSPKENGHAESRSDGVYASSKDLFNHRISLHPPKEANERGVGLINKGNTCYMNSTLQALLHLPPLSHTLLTYEESELYGKLGARPSQKFDAIGEMVSLAQRVLTRRGGGAPTAPVAFLNNLKSYARTLSKFRQEDAHEFLRFLLEAMQYCCLLRAPKSMKPNDPIRETTLIHKIFGGKLRSRVQCQRCKHNSDTFDPILDLSLDLRKSSSVTEALDKFTSVDVLTGSEKYRCEKCKKAVDATKWFTIHEAPTVLTIHLKRFTLAGQKITRQIHYSDSLILSRAMLSEGQSPQHYKLRSIVHHHGNSPNSGHYVASVKGNGSNRWYEMNDSSVYPVRATPVNSSDAYILFYVRDPGHALNSVVRTEVSSSSNNNNSKRRMSEAEIDERRIKRREDSSSPVSMLKKPLLASSPSLLQHRQEQSRPAINPSTFYATSTPQGTNTSKPKSPMFRNMNFGDSDDNDDDIGQAIESHETLLAKPTPSKHSTNILSSAFKKRKNRDTLKLGIRAGNQKSSLIGSPYRKIGKSDLQKPLYARMKDKHGHYSK